MKRSDLEVGKHYAVAHPQYRSGMDPVSGLNRARRVKVLDDEPWVNATTRLARRTHLRKATAGDKGAGVLVRVLEDDGKTPNPYGQGVDDDARKVVSPAQFWMPWDDWKVERDRRKAEHDAARAESDRTREEVKERVAADLMALADIGIEHDVRPMIREPRLGNPTVTWAVSDEAMRDIIERLGQE